MAAAAVYCHEDGHTRARDHHHTFVAKLFLFSAWIKVSLITEYQHGVRSLAFVSSDDIAYSEFVWAKGCIWGHRFASDLKTPVAALESKAIF